MAGGSAVPVYAARQGNLLIVRPDGACTVAICETVRTALQQFVAGGVTEVCFHLARADWLDSTFTGFLVSLVNDREPFPASVSLARLSDGARKVLSQMYVLSLFPIRELPPGEHLQWERLPEVSADAGEFADRVIDSHERLIGADARNAEQFQAVVNVFKAQRDRGRIPPGSEPR